MSSNLEQAVEEACASCGITGGDDVKLRLCTACKLVKYCGVECQKNHRPQHKRECKKRAAELRDDNLFRQPEESDSSGECPICCLPLPIDDSKYTLNSCCCKLICNGCDYANQRREEEEGLEHKCAYCREPMPMTEEENKQNEMKRAKANDPVALRQLGGTCCEEGDYEGAFNCYTKAAALGDTLAHYNLSFMYGEGEGVKKDLKKKLYHLEEAAIGGHPSARYNLGCYAGQSGKHDKAMKHFIIGAKLGHDKALDKVKTGFALGIVSKDDYEAAIRGYQAAVDAAKSAQREEAEKAKQEGLYHTL